MVPHEHCFVEPHKRWGTYPLLEKDKWIIHLSSWYDVGRKKKLLVVFSLAKEISKYRQQKVLSAIGRWLIHEHSLLLFFCMSLGGLLF